MSAHLPGIMINNVQSSQLAGDSNAVNCIRAQHRHTAVAVRSTLGKVVDLSPGGARIIATSVPRSPVDVEFYAMNKSVTVGARVAWSRRTGSGFQCEIGLVFPRLTRQQRELVKSLASDPTHRAFI